MIIIKSSTHEEEFTKIRLLPVSLKIFNLEKTSMCLYQSGKLEKSIVSQVRSLLIFLN